MKETIYAKTLNPEYFDYRVYDIREDDGNEVIIDGEKSYHDVDNKDYLAAIKKTIKVYDSWDYEYYYKNSIMDFLKDNLPKKENGKRLSPKEANRIKKVLDLQDKHLTACVCLSIITGKTHTCKKLCGCCQGEVVYAYYPEDTSNDYIDFVEAWFFGTGTEILIYDGDLEPETADDIEDGCTFYTASWRVEDLKKEIREYVGAKEDVDVKLWLYKDTRKILVDQYELAD